MMGRAFQQPREKILLHDSIGHCSFQAVKLGSGCMVREEYFSQPVRVWHCSLSEKLYHIRLH